MTLACVWGVNVFSIDVSAIKFKRTGPDNGGSVHPENDMNETSRTFILQR